MEDIRFTLLTLGMMETLQARNFFSKISSCFLSSSSSPLLNFLSTGWSGGLSPAMTTTCLKYDGLVREPSNEIVRCPNPFASRGQMGIVSIK